MIFRENKYKTTEVSAKWKNKNIRTVYQLFTMLLNCGLFFPRIYSYYLTLINKSKQWQVICKENCFWRLIDPWYWRALILLLYLESGCSWVNRHFLPYEWCLVNIYVPEKLLFRTPLKLMKLLNVTAEKF